jgi:hypothetical protein
MRGVRCRNRFDEVELTVVASGLFMEAGAAAEQDRYDVDPDLVDVAASMSCWPTETPLTPTFLSPATALACSTTLSMPSVTKV